MVRSEGVSRGGSLSDFLTMALLVDVTYDSGYAFGLMLQFSGLGAVWAKWGKSVLVMSMAFAAVTPHSSTVGNVGERGCG